MTILRVFLYGLLAFVTDDPGEPYQDLTILMVDARRPPVSTDGCQMHKHRPLLFHRQVDNCPEPCRVERGLCSCPLNRVNVTLNSSGIGEDIGCKLGPGCPASPLYWYVPGNLGSSKANSPRLRSDCLFIKEKANAGPSVCDFVVAQVSIPPGELFACDAMGDNEKTIDRLRMFREYDAKLLQGLIGAAKPKDIKAKHIPLNSLLRPGAAGREQPIATVLLMTRKVLLDKGFITFTVKAFDDAERYDIAINVKDSVPCRSAADGRVDSCLDVIIANVPEASRDGLQYARCHSHDVARDFELYEDLTEGGAGLDERPVPHVAETDTYSMMPWPLLCGSDILLDLAYWMRDVDDMPACPTRVIKRPIQ